MVDFDNKSETTLLLTRQQNCDVYTEESTHAGKHIAFHCQCCPLWAVGELQRRSHTVWAAGAAGSGLTVLCFPDMSPLPVLFPLFSLNGFVRYLQCSCSHEMRLKEKKRRKAASP